MFGRHLLPFRLALLLGLLGACTSTPTPEDDDPVFDWDLWGDDDDSAGRPSDVRGLVSDIDTKLPVEGVVVTEFEAPTNTTTTSSTGEFELTVWKQFDRVRLLFQKETYVPLLVYGYSDSFDTLTVSNQQEEFEFHEEAYGIPFDPDQSLVVFLVPGPKFQTIPGVTVELDAPYHSAWVELATDVVEPGNTTVEGGHSVLVFVGVEAGYTGVTLTAPDGIACDSLPGLVAPAGHFVYAEMACQL